MIKSKKGFTLVELIIALSLLVVVMMVAYSFLFVGMNSFSTQTSNANSQSNLRYALSIVSRDIRKADEIEVFENTLIIGIAGDSVEYKENESNLLKDGQVIASDIEKFDFILKDYEGKEVYKDPNKITIEIQSLPNSAGQSMSLSKTIYIRE